MKAARLVYLKDPNSDDEGVYIDTVNQSNEDIETDCQPLRVQHSVVLAGDVSEMPTDRLLVAE